MRQAELGREAAIEIIESCDGQSLISLVQAAYRQGYEAGAQSQLASAAAMREEAAKVLDEEIRLRMTNHTPEGYAFDHMLPIDELAKMIRAIPLPPETEKFLQKFLIAARQSYPLPGGNMVYVHSDLDDVLAAMRGEDANG